MDNGPRLRELETGIVVAGISCRTTNQAEADPATAQIGRTWGRLREAGILERIPARTADPALYGLYTEYGSDERGPYTFLAGAEVATVGGLPEDLVCLQVPPGRYLVFEARGDMPAALIETWREVWRYFAEDPELTRSCTTDVERHRGHSVDLFIAVH